MHTLICEGCGVVFKRMRGKTASRVYCTTVCRNKNYGLRKKMPDDFWARVDRRDPDECWLWTGATISAGYGSFRYDGKHRTAHRYAYELEYGPVPDGLLVCHKCDVPGCCNPRHLFSGTYQDNMTDMVLKGRYVKRLNQPRGSAVGTSILTEAQVEAIKRALASGSYQTTLGKLYGVTTACINNIATGKTWRHVQCNPS